MPNPEGGKMDPKIVEILKRHLPEDVVERNLSGQPPADVLPLAPEPDPEAEAAAHEREMRKFFGGRRSLNSARGVARGYGKQTPEKDK